MKRRAKIALWSISAVVLAALLLLLLVPIVETRHFYCFYCGRMSGTHWVGGLPLWSYTDEASGYDDGITVPAHHHSLIELCGGRIWLLSSMENWDEFGFTGAGQRQVLREALQSMPEKREEIIQDYLTTDPSDENSLAAFAEKYAAAGPAQPAD